jgi:hypothetical protein
MVFGWDSFTCGEGSANTHSAKGTDTNTDLIVEDEKVVDLGCHSRELEFLRWSIDIFV